MSNDKNLADVQPGGAVRLGDQAERARFEAWCGDRYDLATKKGIFGDRQYKDRWVQGAFVGWKAALSAQPSPAGQTYEGHTWVSDYVLAGLRERAALPLQLRNGEVWHWQGDGYDFPDSLTCPVIMSADTLRALLAARQPVAAAVKDSLTVGGGQEVGEEPVARLIEAVEGECDGLAISADTAASILAHVFPLGQTPAAYMVDGRIEQGLFFDRTAAGAMATMNAGDVVPLFRSPAQAVDLGQFNALAALANAVVHHGDESPMKNGVFAEAERLLALIDSQAVGK